MARRDKLSGLVWLVSFADEDPLVERHKPQFRYSNMEKALRVLNRDMGLWVEIETCGVDSYVRCHPKRGRFKTNGPQVSTSYAGRSLRLVLSMAVSDYIRYVKEPSCAQLASREAVRWVAISP